MSTKPPVSEDGRSLTVLSRRGSHQGHGRGAAMSDFNRVARLMERASMGSESPLEALDKVSRFLRGETDDEIEVGRRRYPRRSGDAEALRKAEKKR